MHKANPEKRGLQRPGLQGHAGQTLPWRWQQASSIVQMNQFLLGYVVVISTSFPQNMPQNIQLLRYCVVVRLTHFLCIFQILKNDNLLGCPRNNLLQYINHHSPRRHTDFFIIKVKNQVGHKSMNSNVTREASQCPIQYKTFAKVTFKCIMRVMSVFLHRFFCPLWLHMTLHTMALVSGVICLKMVKP